MQFSAEIPSVIFPSCQQWVTKKGLGAWYCLPEACIEEGEEVSKVNIQHIGLLWFNRTVGVSLVHGLGSFWVSRSPGLNNWHMVRLETQVSWTRFPQGHIAIVETQVSTGLHGDQSSKFRPRIPKSHLNSGDLDPYNDIWGDPRQKPWLWYSPHFPHTFTNLQLSS